MYLNKYWQGICEGDEKALEALFREINKSLFYYALYLTEDYATSEEIVQDVFVKIWQDRHRIVIKGSLKSYLYKSIRNHAINILIHKKTKKFSVNRIMPGNIWEVMQEILDAEDHIVEKIEAGETEKKIRAIIDGLPEQCRRVFILSRFEDKSNTEIAIQLKISANTVKTHIYRALELIRKSLE